MAKFWENLKNHEDNIEKHPITRDEIEFLKKLQSKMNTQDHVGQADPRYWTIRNYGKVYGRELNNADGFSVYDNYNCFFIIEVEYPVFGVDKAIKEVLKAFSEDGYELTEEEIENIKLAYDMESLIEALDEVNSYDLHACQYQEIPKDDGMFLTHEAAIEHLKKNAHHYSDKAHTYAKTAWRSEEAELWNILQQIDFDALRKMVEENKKN